MAKGTGKGLDLAQNKARQHFQDVIPLTKYICDACHKDCARNAPSRREVCPGIACAHGMTAPPFFGETGRGKAGAIAQSNRKRRQTLSGVLRRLPGCQKDMRAYTGSGKRNEILDKHLL